MNWYPRYTGDYMRDTAHLRMEEHGAYCVLLDNYYATERPLPSDSEQLYRICRAFTETEKEAVIYIADNYFPVSEDGVRHNKKADEIISTQNKKSSAKKTAGHAGAISKWGESPSKLNRSERLSLARKKGQHSSDEWEAMKIVLDFTCVICGKDCHEDPVKDHIKPIYQGGSDGIDNIQLLCRSCNASKGPDSTDHRPKDWKHKVERLAKRLAKRLANDWKTPGEPEPERDPKPTLAEGKPPAGVKTQRKPNLLIDALAIVEYGSNIKPTKADYGRIAKALKDIREASADVTPHEIERRAKNYVTHFEGAALTATALAKHWVKCGNRKPETGYPIQKVQVFH